MGGVDLADYSGGAPLVSATAFMSLIALGWGAKSRGSSANAQVPSLPVAGTANTNISGAAAVENVK